MSMRLNYLVVPIFVMAVLLSGCTQQNISPETAITSQAQTEITDLSTLMLQPSDLPANYTIKERGERVRSDVSEYGLGQGWKAGYRVMFIKTGESIFDISSIVHSISIYPRDNISKVLASYPNTENVTYEELSRPGIGDDSRAYRVTQKDEYGDEIWYYTIEFIKKDVYESLDMRGVTDYELLKELAKKAEKKIK